MNIEKTVDYLRTKIGINPEIGIILGSGLGALADKISVAVKIRYRDIPDFPEPSVPGHEGVMLAGTFGGKSVLAFQGRLHYYEGFTMQQVVIPVRLMALLGVKKMIVSNACGGLDPSQEVGDLMIIKDHINLFPDNPLLGPNVEKWGPRFPDMSEAYCSEMIDLGLKAAQGLKIHVSTGVYAGVTGPCLETPAEYVYLRKIGADAVGMSTVPEVIAANHMGLKSFGLSIITDLGVEGKIKKTTHDDVVRAAQNASTNMINLLKKLIENL